MKKPQEIHETAYARIKDNGGKSWSDRNGLAVGECEIDPGQKNFIHDVLCRPWSPQTGLIVELGCGTAPVLRSLVGKGYSGIGIEVSATALELAREQSSGLRIKYCNEDFVKTKVIGDATADIVVDGHCLHCISIPADRKIFMENACSILKPGGLFLVSTMCSPMNRHKLLKQHPGSKLINKAHYFKFKNGNEYDGHLDLSGDYYVPLRYFDHWKNILKDLKSAGFKIMVFQYSAIAEDEDICGDLQIAAVKPKN